MRTSFRLSSVALTTGLLLLETSRVCATVETWTIDPARSTLTLSARVDHIIATPQVSGGNVANYSGTMSIDRAMEGLNTRITFSGGNVLDANANGAAPFDPATGNVAGVEDNYGMFAHLSGLTYRGVVRDLVFDITGGTTLVDQTGLFSIDPMAGNLNHEINDNGESFQFLDGVFASFNFSPHPVTLTTVGGTMQLTIPINVDYTIPLLGFGKTLYANFNGQMVGTRGLVGDYNVDNSVGPEDYAGWRSTFASTTDRAADGNDDGIVDAADYVVWRDHFGQSIPGGAGAAAVPEPTAIVLWTAAGAMITSLARYRRQCSANF